MNKKSKNKATAQVGRPQKMTGGRRISLYLDDSSIEVALMRGSGNVSEGVRIALKVKES